MTIVETERVSAPDKVRRDAREERERRARVLEAAALEIEVRGWTRCDLDSDGRVCMNGAIAMAIGLDPAAVRNEKLALVYALRDAGAWGNDGSGLHPYSFISRFNDAQLDGTLPAFLLRWRAAEIRDGL